jgi:thioredoxin reductase
LRQSIEVDTLNIDRPIPMKTWTVSSSGSGPCEELTVEPIDETLPVVVVGAGSAGLAAAANLVERGMPVLVLEAGPGAGHSVWQWGHVRLFSSWGELVADPAARLLEPTGWQRPDSSRYLLGREWVEQYLRPLAAVLGERVRFGARVVGAARRGRDRIVDFGRDSEPFTVHVDGPNGEELIEARAVIDASGTWTTPNPLGADGLPAPGERAAADRISYRIPDLADPASTARYAGRTVVVAGAGHSALGTLVSLAGLAADDPDTRIVWAVRRPVVGDAFGGGAARPLPERGALGQRAAAAVDAGQVRVVTAFRTARVEQRPDGPLVLHGLDGSRIDGIDEVIALTGFRPDLSWLSEVRLDLDPVLHAPRALAPLIDPNVHSCGTVYPHGVVELAQPEPGLFLVGMKSYGRAPTFLALTGYEQVRSVVAEIAGDHDSARQVELTLPETGVCGGAGLFGDPTGPAASGASCCTPAAAGSPAASVPA